MPRFVILRHDYPEIHWDFMLEAGAKLRTWRLTETPKPGQKILARSSFDHRKLYLDYEGPISDNRGNVDCWDRGSFVWKQDGDSIVQVDLKGEVCSGLVSLIKGIDDKWWLSLAE